MKTIFISISILSTLLFSSCNFSSAESPELTKGDSTNAKNEILQLSRTIPLSGVKGRIDHMAYDAVGQRLFINALVNGTLEIVDLKTNKVIHSIANLAEPQGIVFIPEKKQIIVSCGNDGTLKIFDSENYSQIISISVGSDADNVRYDSIFQEIIVGYDGGMAIVNGKDYKISANIELDGHPESFQIDHAAGKIFVNVPDAYEVEVIDRAKKEVISKWNLTDAKANFPMELDVTNHRIFIGARRPSEIIQLDELSGKVISKFNCSGDADDLFYDPNSKLVFVSCGAGYVEIFKEENPTVFSAASGVSSRLGSRTSLLIANERKYFLAVPAIPGKDAELRIYNLNY